MQLIHIEPGRDGWIAKHVHQRDFLPQAHRHRELELNLMIDGKATYLVGDKRISIRRDTLLWLFVGQEHILLDQSDDFAMWVIVFRPSLVQSICNTAQTQRLCEDDPGEVLCKQLSRRNAMRLNQLFDDVNRNTTLDDAHHNAGLGYILTSAWSAYRQADTKTDTMDVHPAVECAANLLRYHVEPIGLDVLGPRCGLSAARLSRLFKQQMGVDLTEFRNRCRMDRFLEIYNRDRQRNMTEAALAAGFGSYPQFHRVFKKIMGMGPADYRREHNIR